MKKLLLICAMFAGIVSANAQTGSSVNTALVSNYGKTLDTVTNTTVRPMTSQIRVTGTGQTVTIGTANVNLTGTMSGVARLWGSLDGVHYSRIRATSLQGAQVDSLLIGPNTLNYHWVVLNNPYTYYQVQSVGIGTVTFTTTGYVMKH